MYSTQQHTRTHQKHQTVNKAIKLAYPIVVFCNDYVSALSYSVMFVISFRVMCNTRQIPTHLLWGLFILKAAMAQLPNASQASCMQAHAAAPHSCMHISDFLDWIDRVGLLFVLNCLIGIHQSHAPALGLAHPQSCHGQAAHTCHGPKCKQSRSQQALHSAPRQRLSAEHQPPTG
jgi:hypothetical protein